MGSSWSERASGTATPATPDDLQPPNLGKDFNGKPLGGSSKAGGVGLVLAVGVALMLGASAPVTFAAGAAGGAAAAVGEAAVGYGTARANVSDAKARQQGTVDLLIAKGEGKSKDTRGTFFDKLEELFPDDKERIRAARNAAEEKDAAASESTSPASESGAGAKSEGEPTQGDTTRTDTKVSAGEEVKATANTLTGDSPPK